MALLIKPWTVTVQGYGEGSYFGRSRGDAMAQAWRSDAFSHLSFGQFMRICTVRKAQPDDRFGMAITVNDKPAYLVGCNRQYVQFAYDDGQIVLNAHPYDVMPVEARRGTAYFSEAA